MELLVFFLSLLLFLALGIPIAIVLVLCSVVLMLFMGMWDPATMAQNMIMGSNNFPLMAIPFFMLAGEIMSRGGLAIRIVRFAKLLVGRVKGGLGYTAILACIIFAGLSGSAVAGAAVMGSILVPLMMANGYKKDRSAGFICAGAIIAPIIPPSIPMIILATTANISTSRLFMSGIVPGLMMGAALMVVWWFVVKKDGYSDVEKFTMEEAIVIIKESMPALVLPIMIIGGIRFGLFTPTEAGAFAVVYALVVCMFYYKELDKSNIEEIFVRSAKSTAIVMFIVASASAVGWLITVAQIPVQVADLLSGLVDNPFILLLVINIFLFVMGMIMDCTPNILIFTPVLFPVIVQAGIDPYYFAFIMTLNLCLGLITPPVGVVLYVGCSTANVKFSEIVRGIKPFLLVELAVLLLLILFPQIVTVPLKFFAG